MFTGLIRELAKVESFSNNILTLKAKYKPQIGDSIAVNGACLTVVKVFNSSFSVELSPESESILALENYKNEVHIEPAMQLGDRFEGHIVQGHIDCIGKIIKIEKNGNSTDFYINIPNSYVKFMITKGSVAVDGVSLTINEVFNDSFRLTIIPHTIKNTIFKNYKFGTRVNIETDMFARYIYNMFKKQNEKTLSWNDINTIMATY